LNRHTGVHSAAAVASSPATKVVSDPAALREAVRAVRERYRRAALAADMLASLSPDGVETTALGVERVLVERQLGALALQPEAVAAAREKVHAFERTLERADRKLPQSWFQKHCSVTLQNAAAAGAYASVLAANLKPGEDLERLERIELVIARMLEANAPCDAVAVASTVVGLPQVDPAAVAQAVSYLHGAREYLETFEHLAELDASDFFVETRGYKRALGAKILHPEIMAAAIAFSAGVDATMRRLSGGDGRAALARIDQHVQQAFNAAPKADGGFKALQTRRAGWRQKRVDAEAAVARAARRKKEKDQWQPKRRPWISPIVLVLLGALVFVRMPRPPALQPLPPAEVAALSPLLVSGAVGRAMLFAEIDANAWKALPPGARRPAAEALAQAMADRKLLEATVVRDGVIVIQVREGQVLIVR
jgi:hypothetical protein